MTEAQTPIIPENEPSGASSPWPMLVSMLLLIAGLLLSSAMLVYYAQDNNPDGAASFAAFLQQIDESKTLSPGEPAQVDGKTAAQAPAQPPAAVATAGAPKAGTASDESFFSRLLTRIDDGRVKWPKLKLTGFGTATDEEAGFAIINGKQVLVNTYIDEVKLVEIRDHGALVEYKGEQKFITVNQAR